MSRLDKKPSNADQVQKLLSNLEKTKGKGQIVSSKTAARCLKPFKNILIITGIIAYFSNFYLSKVLIFLNQVGFLELKIKLKAFFNLVGKKRRIIMHLFLLSKPLLLIQKTQKNTTNFGKMCLITYIQ